MRTLLCLVLVVLVGLVTPVRADEQTREEARREFAAGQAADRRKDWDAAIEHYLRANDLVPHPFAIFNIATDYERLGKLREAATWFERYLDAAPGSADRDKVNRILLELRQRPALVTVTTIPAGAKVLIDGLPAGTTPVSPRIRGGTHRIVVEKDGQRDAKDVTVEFGEPVDVELTLSTARGVVGPSGVLHVRGAPHGALVLVDNATAGTVPLSVDVSAGSHSVRVSSYGYVPFDTTVRVTAGEESTVDAQLTRALGTLPTQRPTLEVGYLLGAGGGAELRGEGEVLSLEFGARVSQYDGAIRVGRLAGLTSVEFLVRWSMTKARLTPVFGLGYSYIEGGFGYALIGGLRYDISRGSKLGISVLAESGLRYYSSIVMPSDTGVDAAQSGTFIPLMASLLILYR